MASGTSFIAKQKPPKAKKGEVLYFAADAMLVHRFSRQTGKLSLKGLTTLARDGAIYEADSDIQQSH